MGRFTVGTKLMATAAAMFLLLAAVTAGNYLVLERQGGVIDEIRAGLNQADGEGVGEVRRQVVALEEQAGYQQFGNLLGLIVGFVGATLGTLILSRGIISPLSRMADCVGQLAGGEQDVEIPAIGARDEIGDIARALVAINDTGTRAVRVQAALDAVDSPVLIVNPAHEVVYANAAAHRALERLGRGIEVLGSDFDAWHEEPGLSRSALRSLGGKHSARFETCDRLVDAVLRPIHNETGQRLGTVVEWNDVTDQVKVEAEVAALVKAAAAGDFSQRISIEDKRGFMRDLGEAMNRLLDAAEQGLDEAVRVMAAFADGDMTARMTGEYQGKFNNFKDDSNRMAERLCAIVARIVDNTNAVRNAAAEISAGTSDLAGRTEQQASSLEETAASMEELSATVRQNADNAQQASEQAESARSSAEKGGKVVDSVVRAMGNIEVSSQQIAEIVGMIDEIAFQTNLLALNAAVEAARAGDAGKGFAVVASEVRSLAQRTSEASTEIKDLIANSGRLVKNGVALVNQAGVSLKEIVSSVKRVADLIAEIASASREQAMGLEEVNIAVSQMDDMTQKNAALVEESTAAAQALADQSADLLDLVAFFRVDAAIEPGKDAPAGNDAVKPPPPNPDGEAVLPPPAPARNPDTEIRSPKLAAAPAVEDDDDWEEF